MKKKRKRAGPNLTKRVYAFYGNQCVVSELRNRNQLELAHIDDDRANTVFENLLPLRADLNGACENSKHQKTDDLPVELFPFQLANTAWTHFRGGQFPASYGCYRRASSLAAHLW